MGAKARRSTGLVSHGVEGIEKVPGETRADSMARREGIEPPTDRFEVLKWIFFIISYRFKM